MEERISDRITKFKGENNMTDYDVENIILTMADMVRENRILRAENQRLQKVEEEYNKSVFDRCRASEEASQNMLKAALIGITKGKDNMKIVKDMIEYL